MVSPADLNENYMEGPVGEVGLKFNESLRYRKAEKPEEVMEQHHFSKPSEIEFDFEEKRKIKKTIDEPVEHVVMLDDNEEGLNSYIESLLSKDSFESEKSQSQKKREFEETKDVRIKLSDKDS